MLVGEPSLFAERLYFENYVRKERAKKLTEYSHDQKITNVQSETGFMYIVYVYVKNLQNNITAISLGHVFSSDALKSLR